MRHVLATPVRRGRRPARWLSRPLCPHHVPDFFVRLDDGGGLVVDVRPDDRIEPDDAEAYPVLLANGKWLAGYRQPRNHRELVASELTAAFAEPGPLLAGAERVGDRMAMLPVVLHLLWRRILAVDLDSGPLGPRSMVRRAATAR